MSQPEPARAVVLDTNVLLDLLVFDDPSALPLKQAVVDGALAWLATPPMRAELQRVLAYAHIAARMRARDLSDDSVLAWFDRFSQPQAPAAACPVVCSDKDDQKFIDLAAAHGALLLSKDDAVLRLRKRLAQRGVRIEASLTPAA